MSDLISKKDVIAKSHDIVIGEWRHRCVDAGVIMLMPEVDAIPVEWINKRLDDLNEYIDEHGENHMVLSKIQEAICLSRILADWQEQRKEE